MGLWAEWVHLGELIMAGILDVSTAPDTRSPIDVKNWSPVVAPGAVESYNRQNAQWGAGPGVSGPAAPAAPAASLTSATMGSMPPALAGMLGRGQQGGLPAYLSGAQPAVSFQPDPQISGAGNAQLQAQQQQSDRDALTRLSTGPSAARSIVGALSGQGAGVQAEAQRAALFADPRAQEYLQANRQLIPLAEANPTAFAPQLQAVLSAAQNAPTSVTHVGPDGTPVQKPVDNPQAVGALAQQHGVDHNVANAVVSPHQYSREEFIHAMRGMPLSTAESMWSMQHYMDPRTAALAEYLAMGRRQANGETLTPAAQSYMENILRPQAIPAPIYPFAGMGGMPQAPSR
jgi:hypothetical protein